MRSEDEILDELAEDARRNLAASVRGLRESLGRAVDPHPWLGAYPLQSLAAATAAGFLAGWRVSGRRADRQRRGERADRAAPRHASRAGGLVSLLTLAAGRMAAPVVTSLLHGLTSPDGHTSNGHARRRARKPRDPAESERDPFDR